MDNYTKALLEAVTKESDKILAQALEELKKGDKTWQEKKSK